MENLHYLLMKAHSIMQRKIVAEAKKLGLTSGQPKVLDYLYDHEGSDQKTIAKMCEIEPATLVSILYRMEESNLIFRKQHPKNRRSLYVYLTEKGKIIAEKMHGIFEFYDNEAVKSISEKDQDKLKILLENICNNLEEK